MCELVGVGDADTLERGAVFLRGRGTLDPTPQLLFVYSCFSQFAELVKGCKDGAATYQDSNGALK